MVIRSIPDIDCGAIQKLCYDPLNKGIKVYILRSKIRKKAFFTDCLFRIDCKKVVTYLVFDMLCIGFLKAAEGFRIRIGWKKTDEDIVPDILYIQKVMTDGEFDLDYILSFTENPEKGCCWVSEGKRPRRIVNNIPDGWIGVEEDLPEPGKLNENTLDYQNYMCLVQVVEGKSADARPLAFTENRRWVNGNVDMTDYVLAWQDIPKCRNEKVVLPI